MVHWRIEMKYEEFKQKCIERTDDEGYILDNYALKVNGYEVRYLHISEDEGQEFIFVDYVGGINLSQEIYQFEIDENHEYKIEWFVLEEEQ